MIEPTDNIDYWSQQAYSLGVKLAGDEEDGPAPSYAMSGLLYLSTVEDKPWLLLSVPNALVRGVFDGLHSPGIELPLNADGKLDAHISVCRPDEIELAGGPKVFENDRGKPFRYSLGRLVEFTPGGWPDVDRCWAIRIHSPELQALRISHGLSALPNGGKYDLHLTVAVRRSGVLSRNAKSKGTAAA